MRVLVTGAAGFIGSHLCEGLLDHGCEVVGMDNFITGSRDNLHHVRDRHGFVFIEHNVTNHIGLEAPLDWVLHFASPASPLDYLELPIQTLKVGALGTHNALGVARAKGARFLLASTSEVYGDPLVHPQREDYWGNVNPIGPRGCYDEAKRCAEAFTMAYHRAHGLDTRIVRIFNCYGPRMRLDDGRVIPNYFGQALKDEPLTVYGDGSQTRSLCYVDDLVSGILAVLDGADPMPFNIGTQDEITMLELARLIKELANSPSELVFRPLPQDDPRQRRPDTTRARTILSWQPQTSMADGLRRTLEYFRTALK